MSVSRQINVQTSNGGSVTYNIEDHNTGSGLSLDDMERIIRNLHDTDAFNTRIANDLANAGGVDSTVHVDIDKIDSDPQKNQTMAFYEGGPDGNGGIKIWSIDFTDELNHTYAEKDTGESVRKDVDSGFVHEMAHIHDERVNNSNMLEDYADREDYARDVANDYRRELGLPERESHNRAAEVTTDQDNDGDVDGDDQTHADKAVEDASENARVFQDGRETTYGKDVDQENAPGAANIVPNGRYDDPGTRGEVPTSPTYDFNKGNPLSVADSIFNGIMDFIRGTGDSGGWKKNLADTIADVTGDPVGALVDVNDAVSDALNGALGGLGNLLGTYLWPWGSPEPVIRALLPDWLEEILMPFDDAKAEGSPLIVDIDGDGIELTAFDALTTTTFFDIDGDGFAEQTAWVAADDGLLARDINGDGKINDVSELFGSPTVDGFALLAELDSNGDLVIDAQDAAWAELVIWKDANGDAVVQDGELHSLADYNIASIDLAGVAASTDVIAGNPVSHTGTLQYANGQSASVVDAWFVYDHMNTAYNLDYTLDVRTLFLPTLRGFGRVADLHIAMSQDETLLNMVSDLSSNFDFGDFADGAALDAQITDILYRWAGVQDVDPASRGGYIDDARMVEFLEEFIGEDWLQWGSNPTPLESSSMFLEDAWDAALGNLKAQLLIQAGAYALFSDCTFYNLTAGEIDGSFDLDEAQINDLVAYATATGVNAEQYWQQVGEFLHHSKGLSNLTAQEEGWLDAAVQSSDPALTWQGIEDSVYQQYQDYVGDVFVGDATDNTFTGTNGMDQMYGYGGDDTIYGNEESDKIYGQDGNDTLYGENGNDTLIGDDGNDILSGGNGGDTLDGGFGDDTYIYTFGTDLYKDAGGADVIDLAQGITSSDLSFDRLGEHDLLITIDGHGSIQIENQINYGFYNGLSIETLRFYDQSTIDLLSLTGLVTYGTDGDDTLYGITSLASEDDVIYGFGGDDYIHAKGGNNIIDGGDGNDTLLVLGGNNTFIASAGYDMISASTGSDTILIPENYSLSDLNFVRLSGDAKNLHITITGLGQIEVASQFYASSNGKVETIAFANGDPSLDLFTMDFETRGTSGDDLINPVYAGGGPNDTLRGYAGNDRLNGADGNDTLDGGEGDDTLNGGNGDDLYVYTKGDDTITDSAGIDVVEMAPGILESDLTFLQSLNDLMIQVEGLGSIRVEDHFRLNVDAELETVRLADMTELDVLSMELIQAGTENGETLMGDNDDNIIYGLGGNDTIYGYSGNDTLDGGDGNDTIRASYGDDFLIGGAGNDTLRGEADNDTMRGGAGDDYYNDYAGNDTYIYDSGLDRIYEGNGTDTLKIASGYTIDDLSITENSSDINLIFESGVNEIELDYFNANASRQIETIEFEADGFTASLPGYAGWTWGTASGETITGTASDDTIIGLGGSDFLSGEDGADIMHGGAGDDTVKGRTGNDTLYGGDGVDYLEGNEGDDVLYGGLGADTLKGSVGVDTFAYTSMAEAGDTILDFNPGSGEVLDIADLLSGYDPLTDLITDFVEITDNGVDSILAVDSDGGADNFVTVATLLGITGLTDEAALETAGNLVTV